MDAFETLIAELLRREGYWTIQGFKVELTKQEKREIGRHSSPRWELDVIAYRGATNELLVVECKSLLDSRGVLFRNGDFENPQRYKLFCDEVLRTVVFRRLAVQLNEAGFTPPRLSPILCLAAGKLAGSTDAAGLEDHFRSRSWRLFDHEWIYERISNTAESSYKNDIAHIVSKLLLRYPS